jgi:hypothetical protein
MKKMIVKKMSKPASKPVTTPKIGSGYPNVKGKAKK